MIDLCRVELLGRVASEISNFTAQNESEGCRFRVATNKKRKDKEYSQFHTVVVWGKDAEFCKKYLTKGNTVFVEGEIEYREHEGKYFTDIRATSVRALSPPNKTTEPVTAEE